MKRLPFVGSVATVLVVTVLALQPARAAEKTPAEMMPATTLFYMELDQPTKFYQTLLDHPLYKRIMELPEVQRAIEQNPKLGEVQLGVSFFEQHMGMTWRQALDTISSKGLAIGIDPANKGGVLLTRGNDAKSVEAFRDKLLGFVRAIATDQGKGDPILEADYRGVKAYKIGEGYVATFGPWMIVTNQGDLGKMVIDSYQSQQAGFSLASDDDFKSALATKRTGLGGWAYLKVRSLRDMGIARELFMPKTEEPAAELLLGGLLNALRQTPYLTAELNVGADDLRVSVVMPNDPSKLPAARQFFFAPTTAKGSAPAPLKPDGTIANIALYRHLGQFWRAGPDLFTEQAAAKLAQADQQLSQFFGGRDFGNEVLAAIDPQMQLIVARQTFGAGDRPTPAIKLPAFALVMRTSKPELIHPYMQVAYTSIVTFANLGAAQQGYPMLMQQSAKRGEANIFTADFLLTPDDKGKANAKINYNFTPTLVTYKNHVVLASTRHIAEQVADLLIAGKGDQNVKDNTLIEIDPRVAAIALKDNREQLVADNMLKKGHDRAAAEREIDLLLTALQYLRGTDLRLVPDGSTLRVEFGVKFDSAK